MKGSGSPSRTRTCDHSINSRMLYQLSYRGSRSSDEGAYIKVEPVWEARFHHSAELAKRSLRRRSGVAMSQTAGFHPPEASWRSGYAEDCKSLHPGSIPGEAYNQTPALS